MSAGPTLKSVAITDRDASPLVQVGPIVAGGVLRSSIGSVTTGAADGIGTLYVLAQVPTNARVENISYQCAALGTSCTMNIGLQYPTGAATAGAIGALGSLSFFASAVATATATTPTNVINQSGTNTIARQEQPLWQALGLASDPGGVFDVVGQIAAATVAGGLFGVKVTWIQ